MSDFGQKLLVTAIFLAVEVPLGAIAYRASARVRPLVAPAALLGLGIAIPDPRWGAPLLIVSLLWMFALAIGARVRKTRQEEERQLAAHGPSPWLGQSRRATMMLIGLGTLAMVTGTLADGSGHARIPAIFVFAIGSIVLGMGLFRRHTVLVHYLGRRRARWLEVVQVITAFAAYGLATAGESSNDPGQRVTFRLLSLMPFALHFLVVWVPLSKAQERALLPEIPFA